jgi:RNA polymerase sigma-70 factor, ECF subfamily
MAKTTVDLIEKEITRLRRFARCLARDPDRADDLVQECLLRALRNVHTWQPGTNLLAWLFAILRNCHIDEIRRVRHHACVDLGDFDAKWYGVPGNQEARMTLAEIRDAFSRLSADHREVLLLVVVEGLDYRETADILGAPVGTVRSRLSRAREALRRECAAPSGLSGCAPEHRA